MVRLFFLGHIWLSLQVEVRITIHEFYTALIFNFSCFMEFQCKEIPFALKQALRKHIKVRLLSSISLVSYQIEPQFLCTSTAVEEGAMRYSLSFLNVLVATAMFPQFRAVTKVRASFLFSC